MPHRSLVIDTIEWDVYDVHPPLSTGPLKSVETHLADGWLCFESTDGERRRLAPIPRMWNDLPGDVLEALWNVAQVVPAHRRWTPP